MPAKNKKKSAKKPLAKRASSKRSATAKKPARTAKTKTVKAKPTKKAAGKSKPAKKAASKSKPKVSAKAKAARTSVGKAKQKSVAANKKSAPRPRAKKAVVAGITAKPIIRTGPSIAPRNFGKSPIAALRGVPVPVKPVKVKPLTKKEIAQHRNLLLELRDRVIDEISFLANDNLNRSSKESSGDLSSYSFHMADQGTDNFDREFAASLLNSEHDVLYEIDEALRRIEQGAYGVCEMSGKPIERERLKALPFARYCMAVQTEMERGKPRFRPFRRTSIQSAESSS